VNPATEQALAEVPCTTPDEVQAAVARARAAARAWAAQPFEVRAAPLHRLCEALSDVTVRDELAMIITREMGKPIKHARAEVAAVGSRTPFFIDQAREACDDDIGREGELEVTVQWRPLGVVGVISPWNYPLSTPNNLVASALLTGNAVVLKPSELTPRIGARYVELLQQWLPTDVLQVVQGAGDVGGALVSSGVDMVAFTGSVGTGQRIMKAAAERMTRLVLELGGKDPMLVLPGADVKAAAQHAVRESLRNSGQICISTERVFVPRPMVEAFVAEVSAAARALPMGDPTDPATEIGPMASDRQRALVLEQIEEARRLGAQIVVEPEVRNPGYWLGPTVAVGVTDEMLLAREETFGPVVAVTPVDDVEEAIARANATPYGLGACVWGPTGDDAAARAVAARIEAGMVGINRPLSAAAGAPWVGWKLSGFGYSRGVAGMRQFMQPRSLTRRVG
jgi:aldehyde dehydrogenase (NAD+)/succinate-semialdehyde dehydrogenase/glutarate-semialdehyde dehydrogenase